jgi:hypothetical protein
MAVATTGGIGVLQDKRMVQIWTTVEAAHKAVCLKSFKME